MDSLDDVTLYTSVLALVQLDLEVQFSETLPDTTEVDWNLAVSESKLTRISVYSYGQLTLL